MVRVFENTVTRIMFGPKRELRRTVISNRFQKVSTWLVMTTVLPHLSSQPLRFGGWG
ncbi:hypothetical protein L798_08245 [Zootermopsis nevadensis]|uniref:Uncharacterized protein n=1 Tax=Zootermopsis nevadensis TaxID=136037 RepID=A0A067RCZ3_ZOONE|nr:hypothetical protein L798_08245 [Zootermopsis nevadensis]